MRQLNASQGDSSEFSTKLEEMDNNYKKGLCSLDMIHQHIVSADLPLLAFAYSSNGCLREHCKHQNLQKHWDSVWSNASRRMPSARFSPQEPGSSVQLAVAHYFYEHALTIRDETRELFSPQERHYLLCALHWGSIHAAMELAHYWQSKSSVEVTHTEAIIRIKKLITLHKSAAYLLLATTYFRYYFYLEVSNTQPQSVLLQALDAAYFSCEKAEEYLPNSQSAIANASLSFGLGQLDPMQFGSITNAKYRIAQARQLLGFDKQSVSSDQNDEKPAEESRIITKKY